MYKDQLYKLEYYRDRLINDSLKSGEYLENDTLLRLLEDYDTSFSIFKHRYIQEGSKFNVKDFNNSLATLYSDLLILYRIVYELTVEDFNKTKELVNIKLNDLDRIATQYYNRSKLETIAIFGDTLVFEANNFNTTKRNGLLYVKLPRFTTYAGAHLAFLCDTDANDKAILELSPSENIANYESSESLFKVSGEPTITTEFFALNPESNYKGSYPIPLELSEVYNSQYYVYSGHNSMRIDNVITSLQDYNDKEYPEISNIEFFVYNGTQIDFSFTLEPKESNIQNNFITIKDRIQRFSFRMPKFGKLSFKTDGLVFATIDECYVKDNTVYAKHFYKDAYNNMLEVITYDKEVSYDNPVVVIDNPNAKINSIAIKQNRYVENDKIQY